MPPKSFLGSSKSSGFRTLNYWTLPLRSTESQQNHDREVCRLANKYRELPIWSSCPGISRIDRPRFFYGGPLSASEFEPDVFLSQVAPRGQQQPIDWVFEIETSETVSEDHTHNQLLAFAQYSWGKAARVIVLVPPQDVELMRTNLKKWGLSDIIVEAWGWPQ